MAPSISERMDGHNLRHTTRSTRIRWRAVYVPTLPGCRRGLDAGAESKSGLLVGICITSGHQGKSSIPCSTYMSRSWAEPDDAPLIPSSEGLGFNSTRPPGFQTESHVTTSLSTGGGPVSGTRVSERGFLAVYPGRLWSRLTGVANALLGYC